MTRALYITTVHILTISSFHMQANVWTEANLEGEMKEQGILDLAAWLSWLNVSRMLKSK